MNLLSSMKLALVTTSMLICIHCSASFAADNEASVEPTTTTLQGQVVKVEVTLNDLRDARLSISRVRKAAANLYDEVTREPVSVSYNPNLVGTTVIMQPTVTFSGQYLLPRKKWVNASMNEIGPIINLFKEDVDSAIESNRRADVTVETRTALEPLRTEAFSAVDKSFALYKQLEQLTAGSSYDNGGIATVVKSLDAQMKDLDRSLKKGISILQKEAKATKKSSS